VGEEGLAVAEASGPVGAVFAGARAFEGDEGCGGECGGGVGGVEEETHGGMITSEVGFALVAAQWDLRAFVEFMDWASRNFIE
jgi:hypothetical protein